MSAEELAFDSASFSGRARLFPLPNLVMFPHVLQPLHIFEPRYREMLEDAMADDRLIAMSILAPGWEKHYEGRPALESVACLGQVVTMEEAAPKADIFVTATGNVDVLTLDHMKAAGSPG